MDFTNERVESQYPDIAASASGYQCVGIIAPGVNSSRETRIYQSGNRAPFKWAIWQDGLGFRPSTALECAKIARAAYPNPW